MTTYTENSHNAINVIILEDRLYKLPVLAIDASRCAQQVPHQWIGAWTIESETLDLGGWCSCRRMDTALPRAATSAEWILGC